MDFINQKIEKESHNFYDDLFMKEYFHKFMEHYEKLRYGEKLTEKKNGTINPYLDFIIQSRLGSDLIQCMIFLWLNNYISTELFLQEEILKIGWSLFTITEISFHRTHNGDWEYRKDICTLLDLLVYELFELYLTNPEKYYPFLEKIYIGNLCDKSGVNQSIAGCYLERYLKQEKIRWEDVIKFPSIYKSTIPVLQYENIESLIHYRHRVYIRNFRWIYALNPNFTIQFLENHPEENFPVDLILKNKNIPDSYIQEKYQVTEKDLRYRYYEDEDYPVFEDLKQVQNLKKKHNYQLDFLEYHITQQFIECEFKFKFLDEKDLYSDISVGFSDNIIKEIKEIPDPLKNIEILVYKQILAARKIERWWIDICWNPNSKKCQKRLQKEYNELFL